MQTRTRLTTPPGEHPTLSDGPGPQDEIYVRGLALPQEPRVPGPRRRLWVTLALVAVVAGLAYATMLVVTSGQSFDPALDLESGRDGAPVDATPGPDDTVPGDG